MAYATEAELRQYLDQVGEEDTALLEAILERATSIVDGALGFSFAEYGEASERTVWGGYSSYLVLPPHQAGSVTAVVLDGTTIDAEEYQVQTGALYLLSGWRWGRYRYVVTAVWGYGPPPASIVQLTLELAVNIWRSKDKGLFTEVIGAQGGGAIRYVGGLNTLQRQIIENVRREFARVVV